MYKQFASKDSKENLSKVNGYFLEFVKKNPACEKDSSFELLELNDNLFKLQSWPTFINQMTKAEMKDSGTKLFDLIKSIPRRIFNNDPYKISRYFKIPENLARFYMNGINDDHINRLLGRGDFVFSPTGLKCLEYNVSVFLGGIQLPMWESLYLDTPIISEFLKEYNVKIKNKNLYDIFLGQIIQPILKKSPNDKAEINIAIIMKQYSTRKTSNPIEIYLNQIYKRVLLRENKSIEGKVIICDYPNLNISDHRVYYERTRIHVLVELYHGMVPSGIMKAFVSGNISILNGPITKLLSSKLTLALLSDNEPFDVFNDEEKKIIETYVPWTRKIIPEETKYKGEKINDLKNFILSNREQLVIKPSQGYGGRNVCVGRKRSEKEWEEWVNMAMIEKNWVVQEYVKPNSGFFKSSCDGYEMQDMVWGFFIFGSQYAGAWTRVMPQKSNNGVINCHQGATISVVFEVDE